ncbi:transcriptional regulator GcvA [Cucumibacter marinus]|uniref:transcriptional regulator GcvA n=1 Tax=Cucumibacter marinus TaxID=1121252 RepID=UPI0006865AB8|nr:transcriptional regulator GcvA [Cucumibacter marinus]
MRRRLPPLNALRAFESAGRHVSFTRAAEELHVTPGAVSRQIKLLEDYLGLELFERTSRDLRITEEAEDYVHALTDVFDRVNSATERLLTARRERPLRIHCAMTFTLRWLVPLLPLFHRLYPQREIQLTTSLAPLPVTLLESGDVDVAIQMGRGDWQGMIAHRLAGSALVPVCAPALIDGDLPLGAVHDLNEHTLLHSLARPHDWADWLEAAGAAQVDPERGLRFESSSLAYQAAKEGLGVAMGQMALIVDDLETGRLVTPFDFVFDNGEAYYLTYADHAENDPRVREFRDWVLGQAEDYAQAHKDTIKPGVTALSG